MAFLLSACGGSQSPIGVPGAMQQQSSAHTGHPSSSHYQVVYSFGAPPDGQQPAGNLIDVGGTLYGMTQYGGTYSCDSYYYGCGTIFSLSGSTEHVLHDFNGSDGAHPLAALTDVNGALYGTASAGGTKDWGTAFDVTPSGSVTVLHVFTGRADGGDPTGTLIQVGSKLYGTTRAGGTHDPRSGSGTVFAIRAGGREKVLYRFSGAPDGKRPSADLLDVHGTFYGTTASGGTYGDGTVFTITKRGAEKVIYSFKGEPDGQGPIGGLAEIGGTLYGTTTAGGSYTSCAGPGCGTVTCSAGCGTVFSVSPNGKESVVHSFGKGADGIDPNGSLIAVNGALYGTTREGGSSACSFGCGTVFGITPSGTENVVYSFGNSPDGHTPLGGLLDVSGTLYGTTTIGGTNGNGTVYALRL